MKVVPDVTLSFSEGSQTYIAASVAIVGSPILHDWGIQGVENSLINNLYQSRLTMIHMGTIITIER
jgi:hypothetical protein